MIESYTSSAAIDRARENAARLFYAGTAPGHDLCAEFRRVVARIGKADRANRLVKASKSPTDRFPGQTGAYFNRPAPRRKPVAVELDTESPGYAPDLTTPGTWAVVERRDWAGEYRVRMENRPGQGATTPDNVGDRITAMLTERGARKISESCYFMACQRGGFSTFATLTLTPEARDKLRARVLAPVGTMHGDWHWQKPEIDPARARQGKLVPLFQEENQINTQMEAATVAGEYIAVSPDTCRPYTPLKPAWKWSVQREASRFFEAANKMYQRGWQYENDKGETVKVRGSRAFYCVEGEDVDGRTGARFTRLKWWREPLAYLWVAENPHQEDAHGNPVADEHGELQTNPHIHLMMKWRVAYRHFDAWAERLEKLWGHGFAHLEKIKDPQKAGSYVAKAAGYLSKAQGKTDQGEIRGNRYGISKRARAPGWIECERHQVGMMGWLMAEAHELWNNRHGEKIQRRDHLKRNLEAANDPGKRQKIGRMLEQVRGEIEPLPRISKYGALFKSEEQKNQFFTWAHRRGWTPEKQHSQWLHQWRWDQWRRRNGGRLEPSKQDIKAWFALADSGAVECENDADFQDIHLQELRA